MKLNNVIALLNRNQILGLACAGALVLGTAGASANERLFTYSYEPETMPQGAWEAEQWVTLRAGRSAAAGKDNFNRWVFREEIEYGVTDHYTVGLYLNHQLENFNDPATGRKTRHYRWTGVSIENRYMVLNPANKPVGLTLYLEPTYDGVDFELEQKIILGQRHGDWKWAVNLIHATEWEEHFDEKEGELEFTAGLARHLGKNWAVGIEARNHNELPEYKTWENSALYIGPAISYRRENWWATLTVLPQVWGTTFHNQNPDGNRALELEGHERWNIRLIAGFSF